MHEWQKPNIPEDSTQKLSPEPEVQTAWIGLLPRIKKLLDAGKRVLGRLQKKSPKESETGAIGNLEKLDIKKLSGLNTREKIETILTIPRLKKKFDRMQKMAREFAEGNVTGDDVRKFVGLSDDLTLSHVERHFQPEETVKKRFAQSSGKNEKTNSGFYLEKNKQKYVFNRT